MTEPNDQNDHRKSLEPLFDQSQCHRINGVPQVVRRSNAKAGDAGSYKPTNSSGGGGEVGWWIGCLVGLASHELLQATIYQSSLARPLHHGAIDSCLVDWFIAWWLRWLLGCLGHIIKISHQFSMIIN